MENEVWKPVVYRDIKPDMYEVSNLGNFRNSKTGHVMSPCPSEKGYMMLPFRCIGDRTRTLKIHRIVAWMFVPGYDELHNEVNHKDGNKRDNSVTNLEWVTHDENIRHGYSKNLIPILRGERNGNHSLTDDQVAYISELLVRYKGSTNNVFQQLRRDGENISLHVIQRVKYKMTGKHISDMYFDENTFEINRRIMGDDIHIVCQAICNFNGNASEIIKFLNEKDIYITRATLGCIIRKRSYTSISDLYFAKGQYQLN